MGYIGSQKIHFNIRFCLYIQLTDLNLNLSEMNVSVHGRIRSLESYERYGGRVCIAPTLHFSSASGPKQKDCHSNVVATTYVVA